LAEKSDVNGALEQFNGMRATVVGDYVRRSDAGRIVARLRMKGPTQIWDSINKLAGHETYELMTSDEYISCDREKPSIFQGYAVLKLPAFTSLKGMPGLPRGVRSLPFDLVAHAYTDVIGFLAENKFEGVFEIRYLGSGKISSFLPPMSAVGEVSITIER
jgi:hypothetical protein